MIAYLGFSLSKQLTDILFRGADVLIEDFGAIDDLRLTRIEHLTNLPSHESLPRTGGPVKQDTYKIFRPLFIPFQRERAYPSHAGYQVFQRDPEERHEMRKLF